MNMTEKLRYGKGRRIPAVLAMIVLLFSAFLPAAAQNAYAADRKCSGTAGVKYHPQIHGRWYNRYIKRNPGV